MAHKISQKLHIPGCTFIKKSNGISEYILTANGLTILHKHIPHTSVITTNITYRVGARDEQQGSTGLAHMLEHMLFKPTTHDIKRHIDSAAMQFERETGCILNANTSEDRTTYFFNYPAQYFNQALQIEVERMQDVVLSDKEFLPERNNVLSEFDMYNGDPYFALNVQMSCATFTSHPYGHETIGFREDIEQYTPEKLNQFYRNYYRPDNVTVTVVGDVSLQEALSTVSKHFTHLKNPKTAIPRHTVIEPVQEGIRRVEVTRPSSMNIVAFGVQHAGFPSHEWFNTAVLFSILADGPDSILHKKLVDTGLATSIESVIAPTSEPSMGIIFVTLAPGNTHHVIETMVFEILASLTKKDIQKLIKNTIAAEVTDELFAQGSSLQIAMNLTEYISAHTWEAYTHTEEILRAVTPASTLKLQKKLFTKSKMTIGYFVGLK